LNSLLASLLPTKATFLVIVSRPVISLKKNIPQRQATHEFVDDASHAALMADLIGMTQASQLPPALDLYNEGVIVILSSDRRRMSFRPCARFKPSLLDLMGDHFPMSSQSFQY
jgi:hypothetical protein